LFAQNCAVCHGADANGRVGPTLKKDFPGIRVDLFLKETITNGVDGSVMPAWSKSKGGPMSDQDIDDVVAYLRSLARPTPVINVTPPPTQTNAPLPAAVATFPAGDLTRGTQVFAENCVVCHGDRGQGNIGANLRKDWPGIDPDKFIEATVARGVQGSKMPAWAQSNGGPLTNQQIADVTAYIRSFKAAPPPAPTVSSIPTSTNSGSNTALICGVIAVVGALIVLGVGLMGRPRKPEPEEKE
jgi:cytochrome c oxidase cbb3-type subunit 3